MHAEDETPKNENWFNKAMNDMRIVNCLLIYNKFLTEQQEHSFKKPGARHDS